MRSDKPLSILMMDIDHFKEFNDTYGHGSGDECLHKVAGAISGSLRRAGDFAARYGGEEFAALLPYTEVNEGLDIAEKIRQAVADLDVRHEQSPIAGYVTISIGLTEIHAREDLSIFQAVQRADQALYKAKQEGKNRVAAE